MAEWMLWVLNLDIAVLELLKFPSKLRYKLTEIFLPKIHTLGGKECKVISTGKLTYVDFYNITHLCMPQL